MNENNDNNELKLRDVSVKPLELQKNNEPSELKLRDAVARPPELKRKDDPSELKLVNGSQSSSTPIKKEEKVLPPLAAKRDASQTHPSEHGHDSSSEIEGRTSGGGTEKTGSVVSTIFQVIIMIASVVAIIIACYFIYKNLSPDTPSAPTTGNKKDAAESAKPKQESVTDQKKTGKTK